MNNGRPFSRRSALAGAALLAGTAAAHGQSLPALAKPESVSMVLPGNVTYRAKLFVPRKTPAPSIILVHDGWGPIPEYEAMGASLALEGMMGLVIDLTEGKTANDPLQAERLAKEVDPAQAAEVISAWYDWLRNRIEGNRQVGAFGFGPGGRWAVDGSVHKAAHGVAIWCVRIERAPADLGSIYETFVGHFSDRDTVPGPVYVADIVQRLKQGGREGHFYRYGSRPTFYNPRSPDYDKADASLAWRRTISVYKRMWALPPV